MKSFSKAVKRTGTEPPPPPLTRAGAAGAAGLSRAHPAVRGGVRDHHRPQPALHQAHRHARGPAPPVAASACANAFAWPCLRCRTSTTRIPGQDLRSTTPTFACVMELGHLSVQLSFWAVCKIELCARLPSGGQMDPKRGPAQCSVGAQCGRVTGRGYMDVNRISGYIPGKMVFFLMQARPPLPWATLIRGARASLPSDGRTFVPTRWLSAGSMRFLTTRCTKCDGISL